MHAKRVIANNKERYPNGSFLEFLNGFSAGGVSLLTFYSFQRSPSLATFHRKNYLIGQISLKIYLIGYFSYMTLSQVGGSILRVEISLKGILFFERVRAKKKKP